MQYGTALFAATFSVTDGAQVRMLDDDPLIDNVRASPATAYAGCRRWPIRTSVKDAGQ